MCTLGHDWLSIAHWNYPLENKGESKDRPNLGRIIAMVFAAVASGLSAAFAVVVFLRFLRSRRPAFAAWTLGLAGPSAAAAAPALESRLHDDEPGVRTLAVRALGNLGRSDAPVVAW